MFINNNSNKSCGCEFYIIILESIFFPLSKSVLMRWLYTRNIFQLEQYWKNNIQKKLSDKTFLSWVVFEWQTRLLYIKWVNIEGFVKHQRTWVLWCQSQKHVVNNKAFNEGFKTSRFQGFIEFDRTIWFDQIQQQQKDDVMS